MPDLLSPAKQALLEIRSLRARVAELEQAASEPIAIVGLGLRFPGGANTPASFWDLLARAGDAIGPVPPSRWDPLRYFDPSGEKPGTMYTREGGFVDGAEVFDAGFFGISPREAFTMDPQQRLLMEVAWEALEDAGQNPTKLAGTPTGVFVGISNSDHLRRAFREPDPDVYTSTGTNFSVAAGRISFFLGLNGPSIVVDTACSSGLVGLHLACRSLRTGECSTALAGAVNLMLAPEVHLCFARGKLLAFDDRCKTFDAAADGYVRSEGCGVVVLKRLSDALANRDPIRAVIRGSAVNQDGRSGGLTVPNGPSQQAVIRQALTNAQIRPEEIDYVEAHGTGTSLGDPIEAHALAAVLGAGRTAERPLVVGSVKTNIGHVESAAGIAGLIKVILSLEQERIPPHLHFERMNPHIDWRGVPVEIPVKGRAWPRVAGRRRLAGVSSFGFSGTNAHVIVEEAPLRTGELPAAPDRGVHVLALSARTAPVLEQLAEQYAGVTGRLEDICYTANTGRAALAERMVLDAATRSVIARGKAEGRPEVVFLFTGQGAQYAGMGRELYQTEPVFRREIERCGAAELLYGGHDRFVEDTRYTQPAGYALQVALAALWRSWGVEPAIVVGHSVGEYAAAAVAGVYSVEEGMRLITERGRLTGGLPQGQGAMAVILAPREEVEAETGPRVSVAAYNGPENVVISGCTSEVEEICARFRSRGRRAERLRVLHGFHSPLMEPVASKFERFAAGIRFETPQVTMISTVTGRAVTAEEISCGAYWRQQLRGSVRYEQAMRAVAEQELFVEIGPGSTVAGMGRELIGRDTQLWLPSIRRSTAEPRQMTESLAQLWVRGVEVDWDGYYKGREGRRVSLPTYPFDRQRYWMEPAAEREGDPEAAWTGIVESAARQSERARLDLDVASYSRRWEWMDRLSGEYIRQALFDLGAFRNDRERHTVDSLRLQGGIGEPYTKLLGRWLNRLVREGALIERDGVFEAHRSFIAVRPTEGEARAFFGSDQNLLDYLTSCGRQLASILTGSVNPLETLFPDGAFHQAEAIYEHAPLSVYFADIARAALEAVVRFSDRSALRVLEIGAGTGATSTTLLPVVKTVDAEYWFTDVSDLFLTHGRSKFAEYDFVRYRLLDIESPTLPFEPATCDVVVATNVLHATKNLDATLQNVRKLLAPGGYLILCEATSYLSWFDVTTGLIEGWQRFEDDWREDHPLIDAATWKQALAKAGFDRIESLPAAGAPAGILGQHVIIAREPGVRRYTPALRAPAPELNRAAEQQDFCADWIDRLDAPGVERLGVLIDLTRSAIASTLRVADPATIDCRGRLIDLGLDSLMAVELRNRIGRALRLERPLRATLVFEHPTAESVAEYLYTDVLGYGDLNNVKRAHEDHTLFQRVEALSEQDAEALLFERLKGF